MKKVFCGFMFLCVIVSLTAGDSELSDKDKKLACTKLATNDPQHRILDELTELKYYPATGTRPAINSTKQKYWQILPYGLLLTPFSAQKGSANETVETFKNLGYQHLEEKDSVRASYEKLDLETLFAYVVPPEQPSFWRNELRTNPTGFLPSNRVWADVLSEWKKHHYFAYNKNVPPSMRKPTSNPEHNDEMPISHYDAFLRDLKRQHGERASLATTMIPISLLPILIPLAHDLRLARGNFKKAFQRFFAALRGKTFDGKKNMKGAVLRWLSLVPFAWALLRRVGIFASYYPAISKAKARAPHVAARIKVQLYPWQHQKDDQTDDEFTKSLNKAREKVGLPVL